MIDVKKISELPTANDMLNKKYGVKGTPSRIEFEAKAQSYYYAEILKSTRKELKMTQKELADHIGRKREYISQLERGDIDMQLSTFLMIAKVLGIKFGAIL